MAEFMAVVVSVLASSAVTFTQDVLAANNFGDDVPGGVAGPLGLFIILLLLIATVLLIRNMNMRIKRLPTSFDEQSVKESKDAESSTKKPDSSGH
ncbi:hypothetical protein [Fodinicola feengrottensis]|uniref:hypothetical protein n=1 Tax=Fodinicola feengrottensis TaxID=435914 RepID=UPI0024433C07|nr:hypothetical protein [Fodinicola feengrottensis]